MSLWSFLGKVGKVVTNPVGSIVGGITGLAGSGISAAYNANQAKINRQFNAAEAEKNRQFELDMWNKANKFNSPLAQVQRLQEANLNPYLMYGEGASGMATAGVPAGGQAASSAMSHLDLNSAFQLALQARSVEADVKLKEAQARAAEASAGKTEAESYDLQNKMYLLKALGDMDYDNTFWRDESGNRRSWHDILRQIVDNNGVIDGQPMEWTPEFRQAAVKMLQDSSESEIKDYMLNEFYPKQLEQIGADIRQKISQIGVNDSIIKLNNKQLAKVTAEIQNLNSETNLNKAKTEFTKIEAKWRRDYGWTSGEIPGIVSLIANAMGMPVSNVFNWLGKQIQANPLNLLKYMSPIGSFISH